MLFSIIEDNKGGEFFIKMSGTDFNKGKSSFMKPTYNIDSPNLPYQIKLDFWQTSFDLQQVDGLTPSAYMEELTEKQARRDYSYEPVYEEIIDYHKSTTARLRLIWFPCVLLSFFFEVVLASVRLSCGPFTVNCFKIFLIVPFSLVSFVKQIFLKKKTY